MMKLEIFKPPKDGLLSSLTVGDYAITLTAFGDGVLAHCTGCDTKWELPQVENYVSRNFIHGPNCPVLAEGQLFIMPAVEGVH